MLWVAERRGNGVMLSKGLNVDQGRFLGLTFGGTVKRIMKGRTLHGPANLFPCMLASTTWRGCQTDNAVGLSYRKQNDHCEMERAHEGTSGSEDMISVRCAMNDSGEITTFCRRDQEAELRVLAHTLLSF